MATMVCTAPDCQRCGQERGGFQFPWLGQWVRQGALVRTGASLAELAYLVQPCGPAAAPIPPEWFPALRLHPGRVGWGLGAVCFEAGVCISDHSFPELEGLAVGSSDMDRPAGMADGSKSGCSREPQPASTEIFGGLDDNDFAFAFLDYDQALTQAGRAIAHAWLEARHAALGSMLQQVESTIREVDAKTPSTCRTLQIRPKQRKRPLRLKENQADAPEAVQRRVNALCQVWTEAGALKPSGHLSPEIMASWERSCERLAQKHVTQAEAVTISNAIATFTELRDSMRQRGRAFPPQAIDIDHLLHEKTSAPIRSWNALRWLSKHGSLDWPLSHVSVPTPTRTRKTKGPAVFVSPTMLATLEQHIERRWELNDPAWTGLLSSWVIAAGVMRHRHLERSTLRKITMSFAQRTCGVCFDAQGIPWPLAESQRLAQEVFFSHVEDIEGLTSYSWRKLMPTVAHTLHVSPEVANALGDWQDALKVDATSKMPLHYSSVRYVESLKSKARCLGALPSLHFESWELIPEEAISEAVEAGAKAVNLLIPRDGHVKGRPNYTNGGSLSFRCSSAYQGSRYNVEKARAARDAAAMPRAVGGKQVSAFLRDSTLLCARFQQGRCNAPDCKLAHQCSVLFKSGRVCGGKHAAKDCRDKRFIKVDEAIPDTPAVKKKPTPPPHPPKRPISEVELPVMDEPAKGRKDDEAEVKFDRLATTKGRTAQCPTKIYSTAAGGAIWLGGLPTVDTAPHFPYVSLQIQCFEGPIGKRGGIVLPDALHMEVVPTNTRQRVQQYQAAFPVIRSTLHAGEEILVHCMAGRHRAASVAVLLRSVFAAESIAQADSWVSQRRDIELHKIAYDRGIGLWMQEMLQKSQVGAPWPRVTGFIATARSNLHLRTIKGCPLCAHKQSAGKAFDRLSYPIQCTRVEEALAWNRPMCSVCMSRAPASWRVRLRED
eukprot:symbB.v1.2.027024.t1/scaffold2740.1/size71859/1